MEAGGRARCPALLLLLLAAALGGEAEAEEPRPARQRGDEQCHYYAGGQVYPGEAARLPVSDHSLHLSQAKSRWRARPGLRSGGAGAGMCPQCARGCGAGRRRRQRHVRRSAGSRALPFPQPCPSLSPAFPQPCLPHAALLGLRGGLGSRGRGKERVGGAGPRQPLPDLCLYRAHRRRLTGSRGVRGSRNGERAQGSASRDARECFVPAVHPKQ